MNRLFPDGIVENLFETLLADPNQCAACGCSKCNANEQILNCSFVMKLPSLLLVNTVRSPGNHLEKVIRTAIDVPQVLSLSNYLIADYDKKNEICNYILTGSINYKREYSNSGHYASYLFPQGSTVATYINDQTIHHDDLENFLRSKSFTTETHAMLHSFGSKII